MDSYTRSELTIRIFLSFWIGLALLVIAVIDWHIIIAAIPPAFLFIGRFVIGVPQEYKHG